MGNIHSDGRPILGLDCHDLLAMTLDACPEAIFVPAHIWTPHFSLFGAFSGFDSMEECFEELTPQIHAVETGLSSDPPMNWRLSALDGLQLISNSDAHSPAKLGREANLLSIPMSYDGLYGAIQRGEGLEGTIEFFPEEGKYHFDGHRKCHLCISPAEARSCGGICRCAAKSSPPACSTEWRILQTGRNILRRSMPVPLKTWCLCRNSWRRRLAHPPPARRPPGSTSTPYASWETNSAFCARPP